MTNTYGSMSLTVLIIILIIFSLLLNFVNKNSYFNIKKILTEKKTKNFIQLIIIIITITILIYLNAFRTIDFGVGGTDAYNYKLFYEGKLLTNHFEPGYILLVTLFNKITSNYSIFLSFLSFTMIFCIMKFLAKNKNNNSTLLIFMLLCLYFESFNVLRSIVAVFISFILLLELDKNNYIKASIIAIICITMHISSIILFPVIFTNYLFKKQKNIKKVKLISLILLMCICAFLFCYIMQGYLSSSESYGSYLGNGQLVVNIYLFFGFVFILSIKNYKKLIEFNKFNKILIISLSISFLIFPMQLIIAVLYRMIYFFLPIAYALMANILKVEKNIFIKLIIYIFFIYKIIDFIENCHYLGIIK